MLLCSPSSLGTVSAGPGWVVTTLSYAAELVTIPFLHSAPLVFITSLFWESLGTHRGANSHVPCVQISASMGTNDHCVTVSVQIPPCTVQAVQIAILLSLFTCVYMFVYEHTFYPWMLGYRNPGKSHTEAYPISDQFCKPVSVLMRMRARK